MSTNKNSVPWVDLGLGLGQLGLGIADTVLQNKAHKENLQHQKDLLDYQKATQREAWSREDNAVQRRVADLKAAGMNPLLAAGDSAATSSPIQVSAPHKEPVRMAQLMQSLEFAQRVRMERMEMKVRNQEIKESQARQEEIRAKASNTRLQNLSLQQEMGMKSQLHPLVVGEKELKNALSQVELDVSKGTWEQRIKLVDKELERAGLMNTGISLDNQLRQLGIDAEKLNLENLRRTLMYEWPLLGQNIRNDATLKYLMVETAREELGMKQFDNDLWRNMNLPKNTKNIFQTFLMNSGWTMARALVSSQGSDKGGVRIFENWNPEMDRHHGNRWE